MKILRNILFLLLIPCAVFSQEKRETDLGASLSVEIQKKLIKNLDLSIEEEVRLVDNRVAFDRSATSVGLDYSFWDKRMKVGGYYAFLYVYNNDFRFEPRHRYYFNLSFKESVNRQFTVSWRGRIQGTYRDENRGSYKINPKYMMKNRLQVEYSPFGRPWKPFLSCDFYTELNNPKGNELMRIRYQGGVSWRLNRTDYVDFYLRFDDNLSENDSRTILLGVGYKVKL